MLGGRLLTRGHGTLRGPPCLLRQLKYLTARASQGEAGSQVAPASAADLSSSGRHTESDPAAYPRPSEREAGFRKNRRRTRHLRTDQRQPRPKEWYMDDAALAESAMEALARLREPRKGNQELRLDRDSALKLLHVVCYQRRNLEEAMLVLRHMEEEGPAPDGKCYGRVMTLCADLHNHGLLKQLAKRMEARGVPPFVHSENSLLKMYRDQGRLEEVLDRLHSWRCSEPPSILTYTLAADACAKLGMWEKALELLKEAKSQGLQGVRLYNSAIHACARVGRLDEVEVLLKEMRAAGLSADVCTYSTSIDACAKAAANALVEMQHQQYTIGRSSSSSVVTRTPGGDRAVEVAVSLFQRMKKEGIRPNEFVYGSLINTCGRGHRLDLVLHYAHEMQAQGIKLNDRIVISLMDAYGRAGEWRKTVDLIKAFTQDIAARDDYSSSSSSYQSPSSRVHASGSRTRLSLASEQLLKRAYTVGISACGRAGEWQMAVQLLHQMIAQGVEPDVVTCGAAIWACNRARQWGAAQRLFYRLEQDKVKPSLFVCNVVIASFASSEGQWREPLRIFRELESRHGLVPDLSSYASILSVMAHFSRHEEAVELLREMRARGVKPTQRIYAEVLQALAKSSDQSRSLATQTLRLLEEMKSVDGLEPGGLCLARGMAACSRSGDAEAAKRIYGLMEEGQLLPRNADTRTVLSEYVEEGRWEDVAAVVEALILMALHPDPITYNSMMLAFSRAKCWSSALKLLHTMEEKGIARSEVNYETLIYAAGINGQWPVAFYLAEDLLALGRGRVNMAQVLMQAIGDDVLALHGPPFYRRIHERGIVSHQHREDPRWVVDFHGITSRLAVCAMMSLLQDLVHDLSLSPDKVQDLVAVVGMGSRNPTGVGVLGPTLIKALSSPELFSPPLHTFDVPFNPGRIIIPRTEVAHYIVENRVRLGMQQRPPMTSAGGGEVPPESTATPAAAV